MRSGRRKRMKTSRCKASKYRKRFAVACKGH